MISRLYRPLTSWPYYIILLLKSMLEIKHKVEDYG